MQLIAHFEVTDFSAWQTAFNADDEARRDAGLSVLQIWCDADSTTHAFALMSVNDRAKANAWITRSNALHSDDANTVTHASHFFIKTA
ncbi:hypothetical protein [Sulfitobacter guttiformis]|uniref:Uncharacterized protein n=1 Tax=Sulfitobacter guttiformis TaxID=74349 RepID=A0A420DU04_9RHOB|nr:hypothetical protein [Sulfitobacter guttiformis]KIN71353.1 hypothetical protein Z949_513 [Sulfitobacter guttiformis KCTC 32187]RKE97801.1 hypothetical protein C8N30_2430 [Sulfitobacter guttiformis]